MTYRGHDSLVRARAEGLRAEANELAGCLLALTTFLATRRGSDGRNLSASCGTLHLAGEVSLLSGRP